MTNKHYSASIVWSDADDAYVATCPEFPGLSAVEPDMMLALAVLHDAVLISAEFNEDGKELPEPIRLVQSVPAVGNRKS
jgi:predicted RNase H-like HicB family nuclease